MAYIAVCFFNYATIPTLGAVWGVHFLEAKGITQSQATDVISFLWIGLAVGSPLMGLYQITLKIDYMRFG